MDSKRPRMKTLSGVLLYLVLFWYAPIMIVVLINTGDAFDVPWFHGPIAAHALWVVVISTHLLFGRRHNSGP